MILCHLTEDQKAFLVDWLRINTQRPTCESYAEALKKMELLPTTPMPESFTRARPSRTTGEISPTKGFDATADLPPGWAITNQDRDKGFDHRLVNAGRSMMKRIWTRWSAEPDSPFPGKTVEASGILRDLKANGIDLGVYPAPSAPQSI